MSNGLTIATICARGGSVGVPGKNIKPLLGKPLICHTIEQAMAISEIDRVFVSTDSEEIAEVARMAGAEVPFIRPAELATSRAPKLDVIRHLVQWVVANVGVVSRIVDLDPTSPLRDQSDIKQCIELLDKDTDVVITGYEADKNPYFNMVEEKSDGEIRLVKPLSGGVVARQAAPKVYSMNASIYCWHYQSFHKGLWDGRTRLHIMPRERSVDVDELIDFEIVEILMRKRVGL
ncbi:MAG: acylneuraminate cytidylyltransferase family protein [Gammaproteobacteria bacterium]|nr:acylneuraminate cytidylyltransferase family protein [Gammaproteobacteria bacterium]MBU0801611.1 acylneuraminate cytidylyltransferase family protein [Alphaproteobacteria bacterium]MBU1804119.1 acylneuraminate cytidylyltransferase family protein [Gammaproteobacteria bacterium]